MCSRAWTLPAAEIPIGGRRTTLARWHQVSIDADTHRTSRIRPFQSGIAENAIESFFLCLPFYR
jgi:hypothetical protein